MRGSDLSQDAMVPLSKLTQISIFDIREMTSPFYSVPAFDYLLPMSPSVSASVVLLFVMLSELLSLASLVLPPAFSTKLSNFSGRQRQPFLEGKSNIKQVNRKEEESIS